MNRTTRVLGGVLLLVIVICLGMYVASSQKHHVDVSYSAIGVPPSNSEAAATPDNAASAEAPSSTPAHTSPSVRRPIERSLISDQGLAMRNLDVILNDEKKFAEVLGRLHDEYYTDPEAMAMTDLYGRQLSNRLKASDGGVALNKIACGLSVCAAEFGGKALGQTEFTGLVMNAAENEGKLYSATILVVPPKPGDTNTTYRMFFANDPTANKLRAGP